MRRRKNADHNILTADAEGRLYRIFNPPWWHLRAWFGWYAGVLVDRVRREFDDGLPLKRRWLFVVGQGDRRVVSDSMVLPNVPRNLQ